MKPFAILLAALVALPSAAAARPVLERVVIVERHGVRSPTKPPEVLSKYSAEPWPAWPVAPGELTPHGAQNVRLMGAWLRRAYAGALPAAACPAGAAFVWADGADQRTRLSGQAFLDGAFPGCGFTAAHGPDGAVDALFDGIKGGACPLDAEAARQAMLSRVGGDLDHPGPGYAEAKAALAKILDPKPQHCTDTSGACFLSQPNSVAATDGTLRTKGALWPAATIAESLLLEYAQGMPAGEVGWGRAGTEAAIASVMPIHEIESDLRQRTPYIARRNAARLAETVADLVEGRAALPGQTAPAAITLIAGHDTNIANLAGVLSLRWSLPGQPDSTPPDGALVFEVWRDGAARYVKVAMVYQTLAQLRDETPLDGQHPPGRVSAPIPGCTDGPGGACPLPRFRALIDAAVPASCRRPEAR